jgi:hypothetical protein
MRLLPGANDVRRLPAGTYFVSFESSGAAQKITVQR